MLSVSGISFETVRLNYLSNPKRWKKLIMINILSSQKYVYLKQNILKLVEGFNDIEIATEIFPDGEHYWKIVNPEQLRHKPAVYIAGTVDDESIFELYNIASTLVREQCSSLHLVIPYFGYSTMERAIKDGEVVTAKNIANLISSIPQAPLGNFVYMMDLHSLGTQYYFENTIHPIHLTSWNVIKNILEQFGRDIVLASTDMGRAKWIEKMGNELHLETAYIMKKRISGSKTEILALNAEVKNKDIVIFDDMIRSGSSLIHAAEAYKNAGANNIYVITVHGIFVSGSLERLKLCGIIKQIFCTNTHANTQNIKDEFVKVYDISEVIAEKLETLQI